MNRTLKTLCALAALALSTSAEAVDPATLKTDLVRVDPSGVMTITSAYVCERAVDGIRKKFQMLLVAGADSKDISRDRFVMVYGLKIQHLTNNCTSIAGVIGTPDIQRAMIVTPLGIQISTTQDGKTTRETLPF